MTDTVMPIPSCTGGGYVPFSRSDVGETCCKQGGKRCPNLVENVGGRRFACGVMLKYGTWEAMATAPEYQPIADYWESIGEVRNYCETFDPSFCCRPEYRLGRRNEDSPLPDPVPLSDPVVL